MYSCPDRYQEQRGDPFVVVALLLLILCFVIICTCFTASLTLRRP
jgi:hypothetical protein